MVFVGEGAANPADEFHKRLGVPVGNVDADEVQAGMGFQNPPQSIEILVGGAGAHHDPRVDVLVLAAEERLPFGQGVMFVDGRQQPVGAQDLGDLKGADGIHIGGDDRHPGPLLAAVQKREGSLQRHLGATFQIGAFGSNQYVLEA